MRKMTTAVLTLVYWPLLVLTIVLVGCHQDTQPPKTIEIGGVKYRAVTPEAGAANAPTMEMAAREMMHDIFHSDWFRFRRSNQISTKMIPDQFTLLQVVNNLWPFYAYKVQNEDHEVVTALMVPTIDDFSVHVAIAPCDGSNRSYQFSASSSTFSNYKRNVEHYDSSPQYQNLCEMAHRLLG